MQFVQETTNRLAELVAMRLVHERDKVVHFLRTRTNRFVPKDIGNDELRMTISEMLYTPSEHQKLSKIVAGEMDFLYVEPISASVLLTIKIVTAVFAIGASGVAIASNIKNTQEQRESAISGLSLNQVEYDKQFIENRQAMSADFFAKVIAEERRIQEAKTLAFAQERRQKLVYFAIFIAIITASFSLIIRK
jgi:hypothetical protein